MNPEAENQLAKKATTGLVLGIIGMLAWMVPLFGLPIAIIGLVKSIRGMESASQRACGVAGLTLCIIGLVLTVGNAAVGAYLGATGQHYVVNELMGIGPAYRR